MFECVQICTVSDTPSTPPPLRSARRGLSGIGCRPVQRVQRPGVCVVPCVVCPATCYVQAVRVRWGAWVSTGGVYRQRRGGVGHARDKIFQRKRRFSWFVLLTPTPPSQNETYLIVQVSKNSKKYKKTPFEVLDVVYLTERKGNLKWII